MMNFLSLKNKLSITMLGLLFIPLLYSLDVQALNYKGPFKFIKSINNQNVHKILDSNDTSFVLKVHYSIESALSEMIRAEIGKNIINISDTKLLSNTVYLDGESLTLQHNQIFTLHTFIEGETFFNNGPIFQAISNDDDLKNITENDLSFAQIIAFNLFIHNSYCPTYSLLKDKKTNLFYLIDTNFIFGYCNNDKKDPVTVTYQYLKTINKEDLSSESIQALKKFNETLNHLISLYPLDNLRNLCIKKAMELETSCYDITNLSLHVENIFNDNEMNEMLVNHFNKIKMIHAHINYLTA